MKKQLFYIPLLLINFTACSINSAIESLVSQQAEKTANKSSKHSQKKSVEGIISVDIVNFNNRLHLLTGKQQHETTYSLKHYYDSL